MNIDIVCPVGPSLPVLMADPAVLNRLVGVVDPDDGGVDAVPLPPDPRSTLVLPFVVAVLCCTVSSTAVLCMFFWSERQPSTRLLPSASSLTLASKTCRSCHEERREQEKLKEIPCRGFSPKEIHFLGSFPWILSHDAPSARGGRSGCP